MGGDGLSDIPGLRYVPEYIDSSTHDRLLNAADSQPWKPAGGRRVQFHGYVYDYKKRAMQRTGDLPDWALEIAMRLERDGVLAYMADELLVTEYQRGQGIPAHVDAPLFEDDIVSVSLGSTCVMEFINGQTGGKTKLLIEPRSLLVLSGESRNGWQHSVPARDADVWMGRTLQRARRVSLTFRKVKQDPDLLL
jgi:alkylated DNA repair dioxygenase AlkB